MRWATVGPPRAAEQGECRTGRKPAFVGWDREVSEGKEGRAGQGASQKGGVPGAGCAGSGARIRHEHGWMRQGKKYCCHSQHHALTFIWSTPTETQRLAWCKSKKCLASSFFKASLHLWTSLILLASQQDAFLFKEQREGGVQEKPSRQETSALHRACAGARPAFQAVVNFPVSGEGCFIVLTMLRLRFQNLSHFYLLFQART